MALGLNDLLVQPGDEAIRAAAKAWEWRLPEPWKPVVCSAIGDIFLKKGNDEVWWLDCGRNMLERIADNEQIFSTLLDADHTEAWFLPPLVEALRQSGKILSARQCYSFTILPIFAEGKYESQNMHVLPAQAHYCLTADLHRQIRDMPDGAKIELKIVP